MHSLLLVSTIILSITNGLDLKENQLVNGDFSTPHVATKKLEFYDYNISGWTCTRYCQIDNCAVFIKKNLAQGKIYNDCSGQAIDLNSANINQAVTQLIMLRSGTYQLSLSYYVPVNSANFKQLYVFFNGQIVFTYVPIVFNQFKKYRMVELVPAVEGINNLTLTMTGPVADGTGFNINEVSLQRVYDHNFEAIMNETILSSFSESFVSIPAYRVVFGELANFFVSFDRWQFYIFHRRNHTYSSRIFLLNIYNLMSMKGTFLQSQMNQNLNFVSKLNDFISSLDYKSDYTAPQFKEIEDGGNGFISNNSNILVYSIPLIFLLQFIFLVLFRLTHQFPFSKIFRKYSFLGIILVMLFQGNLQQFTFYFFQELLLLFSASLRHKIVNVFLVFLLFFMIFLTLFGFVWAKINYGKYVRYFSEDYYSSKLAGLVCCSLDRGLVCICFGVIHSLLLPFPTPQLVILILLETLWIYQRVCLLSVYRQKQAVWLQILSGFNRIMFQLTSLAHHLWPYHLINDKVHPTQISIFLFLWLIYAIISVRSLIREVADMLNRRIIVHKKKQKSKEKKNQSLKGKEINLFKGKMKVKLVYQTKQIFLPNLKKLRKNGNPYLQQGKYF